VRKRGNAGFARTKLSLALMGVLSAHGAASAADAADAPEATDTVSTIVVTAQRRRESAQDVPISIQAMTGKTLNELKVTTIDEFVKYLPSVTVSSLGPGQNNVYMRGLSTGATATEGTASVGNWPNVAVYLDEQSTQIPGRNLDVYAADLERIEVLEGPQGTLFGAGAQAGVLRYITNKPRIGVFEGSASGGYGTTVHGANSSKVEAVLNVPVADHAAVRGVAFYDQRGGYIDNVPGTFTRKGTDLGFQQRTNGQVPVDSVAINNYSIAGKAINPVTYKGIRIGLNYEFNDDWNALLTQTYQDMVASGVFYQMPNSSDGQPLQRLEVTLFNNGLTTDNFSNSALTINGRIGALDLVYSGAYLRRDSFQVQDYTNYARGVYGSYYQCTGYSGASVNKCYTPSSVWRDTTHNSNISQELRLSTPSKWTLTGVGGVFWEQRKVNDDTEWQYKSVPECDQPNNGSCFYFLDPEVTPKFGNAQFNNGGRRGSTTGFFDDFKRTYKQWAIFGSADWHITSRWTLTAGTRYYHITNEQVGGDAGSFYCKHYGSTPYFSNQPCTGPASGNAPYGTNFDNMVPHSQSSSGAKSRVNMNFKPTQDTLVYATWSQGYRPGGFNRGATPQLKSPLAGNPYQWHVPVEYQSDELTNKELGWKTDFFDRHLQFNGAIYQEDWKNAQTGIFAPQSGFGNLTVVVNGPDYRVRGFEMSLVGRLGHGLTVQGSGSYNHSELSNSPCIVSPGISPTTPNNPVPAGQCVTRAYVGGVTPVVPVKDVFGHSGDPLANSPKVQFNLRGRKDGEIEQFHYYGQLGLSYQSTSLSRATFVHQHTMPHWTEFSGSMGIGSGPWMLELVGTNLTNINKSLSTNEDQFVVAELPQRPRTFMLQFSYVFKEKK
jgi:iron complex outermembrane recepter protein